MKTTLIIGCLVASLHCFSQDPDFLKKYSYMCFTHNGENAHTGTCFFYKEKSKIYVVSNYHVFFGVNTILGVQEYKVDTLYIIYRVKDSLKNSIYKLFVGGDMVSVFKHYDTPDIMAYSIKPPKGMKLNYINDVMDKHYIDSIPIKVFIYGYPTDLQYGLNVFNDNPRIGIIKGDYLTDFRGFPDTYIMNEFPYFYRNFKSPLSDYLNTRSQDIHANMLRTEFEVSNFSAKGNSGSRVFGEYKSRNKTIYKFIGVVFGSNNTTNTTVCVNLKYIYSYLTN